MKSVVKVKHGAIFLCVCGLHLHLVYAFLLWFDDYLRGKKKVALSKPHTVQVTAHSRMKKRGRITQIPNPDGAEIHKPRKRKKNPWNDTSKNDFKHWMNYKYPTTRTVLCADFLQRMLTFYIFFILFRLIQTDYSLNETKWTVHCLKVLIFISASVCAFFPPVNKHCFV